MAQRALARTVMIGCGGMARYHIQDMLRQQKTTQIRVVCEPSAAAYEATVAIFAEAGLEAPPNQPDLARLLHDYAGELDTAFIITPHAYHHDQATACLDAGIDVLLEKPMVITADEAESLIARRDASGRLLVVAFPGSLSPRIRRASQMLRSGELGAILNISGVVWQNWGPNTSGTWRQVPEIAGGGFLFDTGAHLLNTVTDLAGEAFTEVAAWFDNNGRPVETRGVVIGRLASGGMVTFNACGEAIPSCASDVRIFTEKAILYTGIWGEHLSVQYDGDTPPRAVRVPPSLGVWEQFLAVRSGKIANPCPPEVGLRMARLWDAIRASAAQGGAMVRAS
ncbi:MAG TPA: Gfo/Idh/MocA family oxidoreductase [Roseiflexaceae bacterium]|nr:Gfo/Idh/MocA family oxidoreductase [Roseiflexaceae bacterium]